MLSNTSALNIVKHYICEKRCTRCTTNEALFLISEDKTATVAIGIENYFWLKTTGLNRKTFIIAKKKENLK